MIGEGIRGGVRAVVDVEGGAVLLDVEGAVGAGDGFVTVVAGVGEVGGSGERSPSGACLLYTSDAADE